MKSSKWMVGLIAVVLMLALAPSSFAQVQLIINNPASAGEISTNRTANTADVASPGSGILVSGSLIAASTLTTTDLVLTFPATISSGATALSAAGTITAVPSLNDGIRIEGATGLFASVTAVATVNYAAGTITVTLPGFPPPTGNNQSGSFRITGVRLDVNGKTAPLAITSAALSSSANSYIAPSSLPTLISSLGAGIASFASGTISAGTSLGTALLFANQGSGAPADATASVVLTEGFASAWRTRTQTATTGVGTDVQNGSNILLSISGLPSGITATLSRVVIAGPTQPGIALTSTSLTSASTTSTISFTSTDLTAVESIGLDVILSYTGTVTLPLSTPGIQLSATMTPNSTTTLVGGVPSGVVARFTASTVGPVTIANVAQATSTLLLPYAARVGTVYDTGIAVANTTKDPFTTGSATPAAGTVRFDLFPRSISGSTGSAGTQTTIQTSATVRPGTNGGGLDANGNIPAGGTWSATLSELMAAASPAVTGDFIGYIFIQTNFVDAHGVSYILENGRVAGTVPLLVLDSPASVSRNTTGKESLAF